MSALLLLNGRLIDPANGIDSLNDLLLLGGKVAAVGKTAQKSAPSAVRAIDISGLVVCPGFIDCHVHFREPGQSAKETIGTGSAAAARGGFTTVVCMPDTTPSIDTAGTVALIRDKIKRQSSINVLIAGAVTKGLAGEELAPIGSLKGAGVIAITDNGRCIQNNELMRRALEYAHMFALPILDACRDDRLVGDGVMHEGYWSAALGLPGWPASGEEIIVARNIHLAELTKTHVHCQNVSTAGSVRLIQEARRRGIPVSGETCPQYFTLTDAALAGSDAFWKTDGKEYLHLATPGQAPPQWPSYDACFKTAPPLRSAADRQAIIQGLADGALEIISCDHAPHCGYEQEVEFDAAPFGIAGLETELSISLSALCHTGRLSLPKLVERLSVGPSKLLRLDKGNLAVGKTADLAVFAPEQKWTFNRNHSLSKGKNTPFHNWPMRGRNLMTIVDGEIIWQAPNRFAS